MGSHRLRVPMMSHRLCAGGIWLSRIARMTCRVLTTALLSSLVLMAMAPASFADDNALVARTMALLSMYRSVVDAADMRRGIVTAPRIATVRAPETVHAVFVPAGNVWTTIRRVSSDYRIPVRIILAVIAAESAFDPRAVSRAGARGLMQIMPLTARDLGVDPNDLFDPCINVDAGTRYMRFLADRFEGHTRAVLAAYNAGPQRVLSRRRLPGETVTYLRRVETHYVNGVRGLPRAWRARLASACGAS